MRPIHSGTPGNRYQHFPLFGGTAGDSHSIRAILFCKRKKIQLQFIYFLKRRGFVDGSSVSAEEECYVEPPAPDHEPGLCRSILLIPKHHSEKRLCLFGPATCPVIYSACVELACWRASLAGMARHLDEQVLQKQEVASSEEWGLHQHTQTDGQSACSAGPTPKPQARC